ncbi:hypothetical protein [Vibrio cholerae]|uniref:hypothetical protein n=1 Tax=Vibrio cholerae TaxID=666 RepID=UPI0011D622C4|nr:hypothetical protein [Vibrio cholerae]TYA08487.1 hypothetical protein FXE34_07020 [Vibrio cholerae]
MKSIYAECIYTIIKKRPISESDFDAVFHKKVGCLDIDLTVSYSKSCVLVKVRGAELEDSFIAELAAFNRFEGDKLSKDCKVAVSEIFHQAKHFTRQVLSMLKYHLNHYDIEEQLFSIKSELWGVNEKELHELPSQYCVSVSSSSICPLREDIGQSIQSAVDNKVEPLLAMRHLHRAKTEFSPHHKWIDATIAAELAIKEALSKARPELEPLLLDLPSPPLSKLYGKIMAEYFGESSPYKNQIDTGVQIRNKLVHRHDSPSIDTQKANDYVKDVERAIFHLLTLLYPDDQLIKQTYARAKL